MNNSTESLDTLNPLLNPYILEKVFKQLWIRNQYNEARVVTPALIEGFKNYRLVSKVWCEEATIPFREICWVKDFPKYLDEVSSCCRHSEEGDQTSGEPKLIKGDLSSLLINRTIYFHGHHLSGIDIHFRICVHNPQPLMAAFSSFLIQTSQFCPNLEILQIKVYFTTDSEQSQLQLDNEGDTMMVMDMEPTGSPTLKTVTIDIDESWRDLDNWFAAINLHKSELLSRLVKFLQNAPRLNVLKINEVEDVLPILMRNEGSRRVDGIWMNLRALRVNRVEALNQVQFENLKSLALIEPSCRIIPDICNHLFLSVHETLRQLFVLGISDIRGATTTQLLMQVGSLLPNLEALSFIKCNLLLGDIKRVGVEAKQHFKVKKLVLSGTIHDGNILSFRAVNELFPNLEYLHLDIGVGTESPAIISFLAQMIGACKYLRALKEVALSSCGDESDGTTDYTMSVMDQLDFNRIKVALRSCGPLETIHFVKFHVPFELRGTGGGPRQVQLQAHKDETSLKEIHPTLYFH